MGPFAAKITPVRDGLQGVYTPPFSLETGTTLTPPIVRKRISRDVPATERHRYPQYKIQSAKQAPTRTMSAASSTSTKGKREAPKHTESTAARDVHFDVAASKLPLFHRDVSEQTNRFADQHASEVAKPDGFKFATERTYEEYLMQEKAKREQLKEKQNKPRDLTTMNDKETRSHIVKELTEYYKDEVETTVDKMLESFATEKEGFDEETFRLKYLALAPKSVALYVIGVAKRLQLLVHMEQEVADSSDDEAPVQKKTKKK